MLIEWYHWVCSMRTDELLFILGVLLLVDLPRYVYSILVVALWDTLRCLWTGRLPGPQTEEFTYLPTVSVVIAGYNEADTIAETMRSVWERYPDIQLIVVDDGSTDGMADAAMEFADGRPGVSVLRREDRGGKSSALNMGLQQATGEILVTVDADSKLSDTAIFELIQPLQNPQVAAVSATVLAWNPFETLCSWLQAYEYRQTIFISRMVRGRLGVLGIVSGAFGAFRTNVLRQLGGWDVGPGEDGDLVLRIRKAGYQVEVAPYANCFTNVPTSWIRLFKQRCRWDRTVITFECRKHNDMGNPISPNFRFSNFMLMVERWFFNVVCVYTFWLYGIWVLLVYPSAFKLLLLLYCCGMCVELLQTMALLFYSDRPLHDLALSAVLPLYPLYQVFMKAVNFWALTKEITLRDSGDDNFVPLKVRTATWRW
ncbi:MAG: glycosyltransferase family 2 protein [Planctomycetaceae bacterium]|nr:glycosyltransferase family 2 protein [Planctomycetaceae bacterium]